MRYILLMPEPFPSYAHALDGRPGTLFLAFGATRLDIIYGDAEIDFAQVKRMNVRRRAMEFAWPAFRFPLKASGRSQTKVQETLAGQRTSRVRSRRKSFREVVSTQRLNGHPAVRDGRCDQHPPVALWQEANTRRCLTSFGILTSSSTQLSDNRHGIFLITPMIPTRTSVNVCHSINVGQKSPCAADCGLLVCRYRSATLEFHGRHRLPRPPQLEELSVLFACPLPPPTVVEELKECHISLWYIHPWWFGDGPKGWWRGGGGGKSSTSSNSLSPFPSRSNICMASSISRSSSAS
ncbi:uncharacterized protein EV422DRAFT_266271 [Fimicolochytrium jonesii]|uniref:uncharacterized protein n=1 Tax=Fimicolochytrium jonesii TaxID=1396493 RepID=UPI0022FE59E8|nr:uncharacterized protein EV422DRAFT_266271 [Fimicolochytrium jonesii]KAI8816928.1 hypothetical protein EV422DRAFT_266271 [Fimicolochytrium jonesii]